MKRYEFKSYDGKIISVVEWKKEGGIKGIIQISHGMAEHIMRYEGFAEYFSERGYLVFGDDHRGHGKTDPDTFGYCSGDIFEDTLKDMAELTKSYREKYPSTKIILFGHSYGSFLSQAYFEKYSRFIDGLILSGSCKMKNISVPFGRMLAFFGCKFKGEEKPAMLLKKASFDAYNKKFADGSFISSIPSECKRYDDDPECGFVCSNNFYKGFFKGLSGLYRKDALSGIDREKPVLLVSGSDDPVGNMSKGVIALKEMYERLGVKRVEMKLFDGSRHEFLNDKEGDAAREIILKFIDSCRLV